jgi:hypothetical protein
MDQSKNLAAGRMKIEMTFVPKIGDLLDTEIEQLPPQAVDVLGREFHPAGELVFRRTKDRGVIGNVLNAQDVASGEVKQIDVRRDVGGNPVIMGMQLTTQETLIEFSHESSFRLSDR